MKKFLAVFVVLILASTIVMSDDDEHEEHERGERERGGKQSVSFNRERSGIPVAINAKWKAECSSCHMLYLPGLLPARSWTKMMTGLDKHFGENAELDAATSKEITEFLVKNSADETNNRRGSKIINSIGKNDAPLRITETAYFIRKHDEVSASTYKRKAIGSSSNCIACHKGAEAGNFSEHEVRIPKVDELPPKKPVVKK
jgi:cytochrome c553